MPLITTLFNHGSQLDANQLANIFLPYSKNPDIELCRHCTIQPARAYLSTMLPTLKFVYAMSKQINSIMKDATKVLGHMDVCQGKALFEVIGSYDVNTRKGRNELSKLLLDKKSGAIGGIYEDKKRFEMLFPRETKIFESGAEQISTY